MIVKFKCVSRSLSDFFNTSGQNLFSQNFSLKHFIFKFLSDFPTLFKAEFTFNDFSRKYYFKASYSSTFRVNVNHAGSTTGQKLISQCMTKSANLQMHPAKNRKLGTTWVFTQSDQSFMLHRDHRSIECTTRTVLLTLCIRETPK